jgi:predicted transcriptional regulator
MAAGTTTSLKLDEETKARLQKLGQMRRRSPHWLMRQAIEEFLGREEAREQLRRDALAAWSEYQTDGLHLTGDEVDAWLARLETGEDAPPPSPHR